MSLGFAIAGLVVSAAGTAFSVVSQLDAGAAEANLAEHNARVAEQTALYNAQVIRNNAAYEARLEEINAANVRSQAARDAALAEQESVYAQARSEYDVAEEKRELYQKLNAIGSYSGVTTDSGSPLAMAKSQIHESYLNRELIKFNGDLDAWRYDSEADLLNWSGETQGALYENKAKSLLVQGENEANMTVTQGKLTASTMRYQGQAAQTAARTGAASSLLTGIGKTGIGAADIWDKYKS